MPLPFSEICLYLSRLEDTELRDPPFIYAAEKAKELNEHTDSWFKSHRRAIHELNVPGAAALLSILLPEYRTDRVYGIREARLCRILSRGLSLSSARSKDLLAYQRPNCGDLGSCLERVLDCEGPPAGPKVNLEEVDDVLQTLAGSSRFSGPEIVRLPTGSSEGRDQLLGDIFKRLHPKEGKWLVRLILKDFSPVRVNEALILKSFHFLLPDLLRFQDNFESAVKLLKGPLREYPDSPDPRSERLHRQAASNFLKPLVGVKVGRPRFYKARSIDSCIGMLGGQRWVLERKYDGEYCEIHIDLTRSPNPSDCINIFSKSGKNSSKDRQGIHQTLIDCLRLGKSECKIKRQAILLAELVVYSDNEQHIMPFDEIRKHVLRSGVSLGTDEDSQPHPCAHLAIVFFDILVLDNETVMTKPLEERRMWLREIYTKIGGRAMSSEWKIVDFSGASCAKKALIQQFAASIAQRCEGLILKPCSMPYFPLEQPANGCVRGYIKLKKDYIAGMADEADLAVVGASYHGQRALRSGCASIKWTDFHLGCLTNKADVVRFDARPHFKFVATIQSEHCIPRPVLQAANILGNLSAKPYPQRQSPNCFDLEVAPTTKVDVLFDKPLVFEVLGSGYENPSNSSFFMLRHARVKKLHQDRTWKDCVSFQELQKHAAASRAAPADSELEETKRYIEKLESKCRKKRERSLTTTPRSRTNGTPTTTSTKASSTSERNCCSKLREDLRMNPASDKGMDRTDQENCERDILDGTTIVEMPKTRYKRPRDEHMYETPSRPAKKQQTVATAKPPGSAHNAHPILRSSPLSDITNTAPRAASAVDRLRAEERRHPCEGSGCLFTNVAVYISPCISKTPYITTDLLPTHHDVVMTSCLSHWDRDSFGHLPRTATVSESQAYEGARKIVLVEPNRKCATKNVVKEIIGLNGGVWRERVEIWDWRVLEACVAHGVYDGQAGEWLIGSISFDDETQKAVFKASRVQIFVDMI